MRQDSYRAAAASAAKQSRTRGWAWASKGRDDFASKRRSATTNQRMEMMAVIKACVLNDDSPLEIVSNPYVRRECFNDKSGTSVGCVGGWKNSAGKPVANRDLAGSSSRWSSTRNATCLLLVGEGHSGDATNEFVDVLATEAADTKARSRPLVVEPRESGKDQSRWRFQRVVLQRSKG